MKLIEIINRRCNCRITKVVIYNNFGERTAYADAPIDYCDEFSTEITLNNTKMVISYSADSPLSKDNIIIANISVLLNEAKGVNEEIFVNEKIFLYPDENF